MVNNCKLIHLHYWFLIAYLILYDLTRESVHEVLIVDLIILYDPSVLTEAALI